MLNIGVLGPPTAGGLGTPVAASGATVTTSGASGAAVTDDGEYVSDGANLPCRPKGRVRQGENAMIPLGPTVPYSTVRPKQPTSSHPTVVLQSNWPVGGRGVGIPKAPDRHRSAQSSPTTTAQSHQARRGYTCSKAPWAMPATQPQSSMSPAPWVSLALGHQSQPVATSARSGGSKIVASYTDWTCKAICVKDLSHS